MVSIFGALPISASTSFPTPLLPSLKLASSSSSSSLPEGKLFGIGRRESIFITSSSLLSALQIPFLNSNLIPSFQIARAEEAELQQEEERIVRLFQESYPSVVFIKDLEVSKDYKQSLNQITDNDDDENAKVEGTGSGFVWDKMGHIVTNYHVIAKLATDTRGLHRCKVFLLDTNGKRFAREGELVGLDPAYDLAVLKVDVEGEKLKPAVIGTSSDLRVGQSCFAIGNPYGYEHTLTTGVVSGLGREIPSPNGRAIRGAIQTDASINAGNSGGPLIDSYGHVIGVNTATFTRKGTGVSSGVNFAIPIDGVVRAIPKLIVYGTPMRDRY